MWMKSKMKRKSNRGTPANLIFDFAGVFYVLILTRKLKGLIYRTAQVAWPRNVLKINPFSFLT